jgi:hypothetical protein
VETPVIIEANQVDNPVMVEHELKLLPIAESLELLYTNPSQHREKIVSIAGVQSVFKAFHYRIGNSIQQQEFGRRQNRALSRYLFIERGSSRQKSQALMRYEVLGGAVLASEDKEGKSVIVYRYNTIFRPLYYRDAISTTSWMDQFISS